MMMLFVVAGLLILVAINVFLWKYGFIHSAAKPETVIDKPVMDGKERKAVMKRLKRWQTEGKLTREEYEHLRSLCDTEWDQS